MQEVKVLLVDDNKRIVNLLKEALTKETDIEVVGTAADGEEALKLIHLLKPDVVLLDLIMPKIDGLGVMERLRNSEEGTVPRIIVVSAVSQESVTEHAFALGAAYYILKPFGTNELRARVNAHLRRENRGNFTKISSGKAEFNITAKQLLVDGSPVPLTKGEYYICEFLARNRGQVFSKEQIYEKVFGFDGTGNDNTITTHIKNIRMKLEHLDFSPVKTVWGIGYKWEI